MRCSAKGCKSSIPAGLAETRLCILHFTLFIEEECAEMRRETALGKATHHQPSEHAMREDPPAPHWDIPQLILANENGSSKID